MRLIWHFQFLAWPDHGCPSDPRTVLNFLEKVNECEAQNCSDVPAGPIIVHCRYFNFDVVVAFRRQEMNLIRY